MIPQTYQQLAEALVRGEYPEAPVQLLDNAVHMIADELAHEGNIVPLKNIREAMDVLRKHRQFEHVHEIGIAWHDTRGCDPIIQRLLAQAMVELGALERADELLDEVSLMVTARPDDLEYKAQETDFFALRGRIRKQRFVQTNDVKLLGESIDCYAKQWDIAPSFFLGGNVLALRLRLHEQVSQPTQDLMDLAHKVLGLATATAQSKPSDPWALATASEACLALHRLQPTAKWNDAAELWLYRFLYHPKCGPFETESYSRQLREVWKGSPFEESTCEGRLARIFERHVLHTQRRWSADVHHLRRLQENPEELEKNFSGEKTFTADDIRTMLTLIPNIGCVTNREGVRMGTGFLIKGSFFGVEELLFVTNAHVISDTVAKAISCANARVTFEVEADSGKPPCVLQEVLFSSAPGELGDVTQAPGMLDVTICRLDRTPDEAHGLSAADNIPLPSPKVKAFVVGHPRSGELQFSLQDSVLLDVCRHNRLMHYRTPTDPGSSGSPVFNRYWQVIAVHHAGSQICPRLSGRGTYEANEGITVHSILAGWNGGLYQS
ncbi:trypsin-like peptidase domain-containing protein [Pseudomonas veronii]